jgi:hypothetical protein
MHAALWLGILITLQSTAPASVTHEIPAQLQGDWIVTRLIPTRTISCWGQRDANRLIGTSVHYLKDSFAWKTYEVPHAAVTATQWTAEDFSHEYCGGPADSCVDFRQLGVRARAATVLTIQHPDANITGATVEIPGDWVLLKDNKTIILSVCNLYFEAHRR